MKKHLENLEAASKAITAEIENRIKAKSGQPLNHLRDAEIRLGTAIRCLKADMKELEDMEKAAKEAAAKQKAAAPDATSPAN